MAKLIVASDPHLRPDAPQCYCGVLDWMDVQRLMLSELVTNANKLNSDILLCGDIFDTPNVPASVVSLFIQEMMKLNKGNVVYLIAGNHSLKYHTQDNLYNSSIGILDSLSNEDFKIIYMECEDKTLNGIFEHSAYFDIGKPSYIVHTLTFHSEEEKPFGAQGYTALQLHEKYPDAKYLFVGDNHTAFDAEFENEVHIINPGTPIIQSAAMIDYQPVCYFIDTKTDQIDKIPFTYLDKSWYTANHLEEKHKRSDRIDAFIETVKQKGQISLSFVDNLINSISNNEISQAVKDFLTEVYEEAKRE